MTTILNEVDMDGRHWSVQIILTVAICIVKVILIVTATKGSQFESYLCA